MHIELNENERELISELLEAAHRGRTHELHRTDSLSYKQMLREKIAMIEDVRGRLAVMEPAT